MTPKSVDSYIASYPPVTRKMLRQLRTIVKNAVPKAEEKISYGMPYYGHHGRLAYFAAFKNHVSFFAMMSDVSRKKHARQLAVYQTGKATLQFPLGSVLPTKLIRDLVVTRAREATQRAKKTT